MDVGVLCTRVRLEEKRLIAALAAAGGNGLPLSPTDLPLPLQPLATDLVSGDGPKTAPTILIDRLADRSIARLLTPFWHASARTVIGAGRAAVLDRLEIARLLADANLPRPQAKLVLSEGSGLVAFAHFADTATLLPLAPGAPELPLLDREIAEAVLEHRAVLGKTVESTALVQAGIAGVGNRVDVTVVDGQAVAMDGDCPVGSQSAYGILAEETARVLGASLIGVTLTQSEGQLVVWDITAVPEFREAIPVAGQSVEAAVATMVVRLAIGEPVHSAPYLPTETDHVAFSV